MQPITPAIDRQVGGNHYKHLAIQPVQYCHFNQMSFLPGCIIKRLARYNLPTGKGKQDLEKAIHELELLHDFNLERFDEPPAYFASVIDLYILPASFSSANRFNTWQRDVVELVTRYNRNEGCGLSDLASAKTIILNLIDIAFPA